jgi:hypothetical protein
MKKVVSPPCNEKGEDIEKLHLGKNQRRIEIG